MSRYSAGVNDINPPLSAMTRHLLFFVFADFQLLDVSGPMAAFEMANRIAPGSYRWTVCSQTGGQVTASCGVALDSQPLAASTRVDTLLAPGGDGVERACDCVATRVWLKEITQTARRVASVCSGAYLLAASGLLDGRRATTHWRREADFARRFPAVQLEADRIYIQDDKLWTSAGITAGIDLSLALIADDLGEAVARQVARQLVVYYRRPGGQSQYSALLDMAPAQGRFAGVLRHMREHLHLALNVEALAEVARMSPRHFARCFRAELGMTPARALERLRIEAARAALESGALSVKSVARDYGFADPERMRRAFVRVLGISPRGLQLREAG